MGGLPALSMYSTPYGPESMAAYFPALGADQAPFYSPTGGALDLKENLAAGGSWPYSVYHPYDAAFAGYPFNGYGMDLNGARRKNATRETTSTLKAWLNEHKKNPYPTKGEKIMLAIITKMTLTQVSTWFANARRRLKKENKMTWEPRNRVEDEDNNNEDDDQKSTDGKDLLDSKDSGTASSEDGDRPAHHPHHPRLIGPTGDTGSEWSESRPDSGPDSPECPYDRSTHPAFLPPPRTASSSPPPSHLHHHSSVVSSKPRIWSLADMASKDDSNHQSASSSSFQYQLSAAAAAAAAVSGRLGVPPVGVRLPPPPPHHSSPYARTHEFYRSIYGPAAAQHLAAAAASSGNTDLLESYQRTLGAAAAASGLVSASGSAGVKSPLGVPLGLTTASNASRMSPSSTSSISSGSETPLKPIALNKA